MVLLYKDPTGESVMEKSINTGSLDKRAGTTVSQTAKVDSDSDNKIASLRTLLKERDDKIAKLESEMKLLKVCQYAACLKVCQICCMQLSFIIAGSTRPGRG